MSNPSYYDIKIVFKNGTNAEFKQVRRESVMGALTAMKAGDTIIITKR